MRAVLLLFFILELIACFKETVNSDSDKFKDYFWKHLGSKTPYRYVAEKNDSEVVYEGCHPKKIWAIIRHGTRYPSEKFVTKFGLRLKEIQALIINKIKENEEILSPSIAKNITLWSPQMVLENERKLAHEGEDEMIELAERFQKRFPTLLNIEYSNSTFIFKSTATERTEQSKYYFLIGLFGRQVAKNVWSPESIYKDPVLRFYKLCKKWLKEIHKNPKAIEESENFKTSPPMKKVLKDVSVRLGFEKEFSFGFAHAALYTSYEFNTAHYINDYSVALGNKKDIDLMYMACSYESAINRVQPSPWCSVFTETEMEKMEFFHDLKYYWMDGYGHNINFQQACPLMKDALNYLSSNDGPTSAFYFAHSGTLLKFLSHLGLYYDKVKLTRDGFKYPRLWKLGYIDAFGSNLAFVSFQCGDQVKVLVLHQERPVHLPGCPKEGLCSLNKILKTYKASIRNCNFEEICKL